MPTDIFYWVPDRSEYRSYALENDLQEDINSCVTIGIENNT